MHHRLEVLRRSLKRTLHIPAWSLVLGSLLAFGLFLLGLALAEPGARQGTAPSVSQIATPGLALSVAFKLLAIVALIYVVAYLLRRWGSISPLRVRRRVTVVESTRLTQRQALHLVQAGERLLLIGATDQGLALLAELDPLPEPESAAVPQVEDGFAQLLSARLPGWLKPAAAAKVPRNGRAPGGEGLEESQA